MTNPDSIIDQRQAEEELSIIRKIMVDSRKAVYDTSFQGEYWTIVIVPALIINYLMYVFNSGFNYLGIVWLAAVAAGTIGSIIIARKERHNLRVKTFAGKILATLGISVGGANLIFSFASVVAGAFNPLYIVPIDSIVMGMAFYVIGVIQQLQSLKYISFAWWAGAIFFFVFPSVHCLLFLALILSASVWIPKIEEKNKKSQIS